MSSPPRSWSGRPSRASDPAPARASPWVKEIAGAVAAPGLRVRPGYQVAGWTIDLASSDGRAALGVECSVHPDGPDRHIERHLTLRRAGWELTDAFRSRWMLRTEDLAAHLATELSRPGLRSS